jgi:hypothetical protein
MAASRLSLLCDQTVLTGIDFIQVVEPYVQTALRVFFVVEPSSLDTPLVDGGLLVAPGAGEDEGPLQPEPALQVSIVSSETGEAVAIASLGWRIVRGPAGLREALEIAVAKPGDFSIHRLTIASPLIDPFFNGRAFSFKQGCPSLFDCRDDCEPGEIDWVDFPVDYLARDFWSLRRALLDFTAARYPRWAERIEADQADMLMEIMAALGDEFAYGQDRIAAELTLATATQRRSRSGLSRLVDYFPDPGNAATAELAVTVRGGAGGAFATQGARAWALVEGRRPIPYSVRRDEAAEVWHHEAWNAIPIHQPDAAVACLPKGATEAWLATDAPLAGQLPQGSGLTPEQFWTGRRVILRQIPADPAEPILAHAVTITTVDHLADGLVETNNAPTPLTHIEWAEPLPFPMPHENAVALCNIVPVIAGEELLEHFRIGSDAELLARYPGMSFVDQAKMLAVPRAIARPGPYDPDANAYGRILRYGLLGSEQRGLGWSGPRDPLGIGAEPEQAPQIRLFEVTAPDFQPLVGGDWAWSRDLLADDLDSTTFALEEGMWRTVVRHQLPFGELAFGDYSGDEGWSVRFGDGSFGRFPTDGSVIEVRYLTAEGAAANLAPDSVTHLDPPPDAPPGPLFGYASAVTNPLPIQDGRDEEAPQDVVINAPETWRAFPLRAVRPEDYAIIAQRLDWVQRARAVTQWTGSWSTDFVAADPLGGVAYKPDERDELEHVVDCIRLAARDARVLDPDYLDIDLKLSICVAADAYIGATVEAVRDALADPGLFNPDNFNFGSPLRRSAIEAAAQAVPGVKGVDTIEVRVRRRDEWQAFDMAEIVPAAGQIIRLENDPLHPSRGSLRITGHGGVA